MNPKRSVAKSNIYTIEVSIRQHSENENGKKSQLKVILQKYHVIKFKTKPLKIAVSATLKKGQMAEQFILGQTA